MVCFRKLLQMSHFLVSQCVQPAMGFTCSIDSISSVDDSKTGSLLCTSLSWMVLAPLKEAKIPPGSTTLHSTGSSLRMCLWRLRIHIYICILGLCIFDLFSPKILISRKKMNFCIKIRKQAIFWIILRKVHAQTKKLLIVQAFVFVIPRNNFNSRYRYYENARALNVHFTFTHFD